MNGIAIIRATDPDTLYELAGTVGWNQTRRDCREMLLAPAATGVFAVCDGQVIGSAAALKSRMAKLVIFPAFIRIAQDRVSL